MTTSSVFDTDAFIKMSSELGSIILCCIYEPYVCHRSIVNEVLVECQASALQKIDQLLVMENKAPSTLHEAEFTEYSERFLTSYRKARGPQPRRVDDLVAVDLYDQALAHMASARAYFRSSHVLFCSYLPVWSADYRFICV